MRWIRVAVCLAGLLGWAPLGKADETKPRYTKEQIEADKKLSKAVFDKLVARMQPIKGMQWPPQFVFESGPKAELNAYGGRGWDGKGEYGRVTLHLPYAREVIKGDADVMALILGHELGHVYYDHKRNAGLADGFAGYALNRLQEQEADAFGARLMEKGGYSLEKALINKLKHLDETGLLRGRIHTRHLSKEEALLSTHPDWVRRLELIAKEKRYWRATGAFVSGVEFLTAEHYGLAVECFDRVLEGYPESYEALVNRGYAYLMLYFDALPLEDVKKFGVGPVTGVGGFYVQPKFTQPKKSKREEYWKKAVASFRDAEKVKRDLPLAKANLALAYLFHISGKPDIAEATKLFDEARKGLQDDKTLDPATRAAVLVNFGVALLAEGQKDAREKGVKFLDEALALVRAATRADKLSPKDAEPITRAVNYHKEALRASSEKADRKIAAEQLETYLGNSDSLSTWWLLAFDRYVRLCEAAGITPKKKDELIRVTASLLRPALGVDLPDGKKVTLAEPIADVVKRLGPASETPVAGKLKRLGFAKYNIEILATDQVLAVVLTSPKAPALTLRSKGVGKQTEVKLKVGMSRGEVQKLLGRTDFPSKLFESDQEYDYYRSLELSLRYRGSGAASTLAEVVVARIPKESPPTRGGE